MSERTLDQVLADWREQAAVLRARGHALQADTIEQMALDVQASVPDYLAWESEQDARLYTGWSVERLRGLFPSWAARGLAEFRGRHRFYRRIVLPHRGNIEAARAAARRKAA